MAWNNNRDRVKADGCPHCPRLVYTPKLLSHFTIGRGATIGNVQEQTPNALLKIGSSHNYLEIKIPPPPGEVFQELAFRLEENGVPSILPKALQGFCAALRLAIEEQCVQSLIGKNERKRAYRTR
jgi:hypothetical protein